MSEDYKLNHLVAIDAEARSCPLCGGKAQVNAWKYQNDIVEQRCFCLNENCSLSLRTYEVSEWNTRPLEDALRSRVEELERERKQIADNLSDPDDIVVIANNLRTMRLLSDNANLQAELARLREMVRWRNPDELPEADGKYWCEIDCELYTPSISHEVVLFEDGEWKIVYAKILRWTFLPEPPEVSHE